jgi:hypothetical protein
MLRLDSAQSALMLHLKKRKVLNLRSFRLFERDSYLRDFATALAVEKYEASLTDTVFGDDDTDQDSPLINFLNWLIENQDQIKALIEMIMSLFAGDE